MNVAWELAESSQFVERPARASSFPRRFSWR